LPVPQSPHDFGCPVQTGASSAPLLDANTDNFLLNFVEPQCGQAVPSHLMDRTSNSLSFPHFPQ
jgi:hypothetical protein